jgi:hypothetical protein
MPYFDTRDIAAIAICASLWGVLNSIFSPIFFRMFGVPFLCDLIGFSVLTLTVWWIGKLGSATAVGLIATIINFILSPSSTQFLGFTAASIVFDVATKVVGYDRAFGKAVNTMVSAVSISTLSAAVAGFIIGTFFMAAPALVRWGGVLGWTALHAAGGIMGGVIGAVLVSALITRGVLARAKNVDGQKIMVDAVKRSS